MKISRRDAKRGKAYLLNEYLGKVDRYWPKFSMRSMSANNRDDVKFIVIRAVLRYGNRLLIYLLYRKKKDNQLLVSEIFRAMESSDRFRVSNIQAFGKNRISVSLKISTGKGKYTWSKTIEKTFA
jgi:hypothetical protein